MHLDGDQLSEFIVRLMRAGISLYEKDGGLRIVTKGSTVNSISLEDISLLREHKASIVRLIQANTRIVGYGNYDIHSFEGRRLSKHLVAFWKSISSGELDATFTNMTHGVVRLPSEIGPKQLTKAVSAVVQRHPALRLQLSPAIDGQYKIRFVEVDEITAVVERAPASFSYEDMKIWATRLFSEKLDYKSGMVRIFIIQRPGCALLGVLLNHFVADLRSVEIIMRELRAECYDIVTISTAESLQAELDLINDLTDSHDYEIDEDYSIARAFWRGVVFRSKYRQVTTDVETLSTKVTKIEFTMSRLVLDGFINFAHAEGLAPLSLFIALHARAQSMTFGYSTTVMVVTERHKSRNSTAVGKMDNVKPVNITYDDIVMCAKDVGRQRDLHGKVRYLPYDVFSKLFYHGNTPSVPILNLIINDKIGRCLIPAPDAAPRPRGIKATSYVDGAEQRLDFEDYSLQLVIRNSQIDGVLMFRDNRLTAERGNEFVNKLIDVFEDVGGLVA